MLELSIFLQAFDMSLSKQSTNVFNFISLAIFFGLKFNSIPVYTLHALKLTSIFVRFIVNELQNDLSADISNNKVASFRYIDALILNSICPDVETARDRRELVEVYVQTISFMWVPRQLYRDLIGQFLQYQILFDVPILFFPVQSFGLSAIELNHHLLQ